MDIAQQVDSFIGRRREFGHALGEQIVCPRSPCIDISSSPGEIGLRDRLRSDVSEVFSGEW